MKDFDKERELAGKLHAPSKVEDNPWLKVREAIKEFNDSKFWEDKKPFANLKKFFGHAAKDMTITPPFYCDLGDMISFGEHFYSNTGLTILDDNKVTIGNNVYFGPHVSIFCPNHPVSAEVRSTGLEYELPVTIGDDVWVGGNVTINPGVTIGNDTVIGSGSVVTHNIPSHVVAAGVPCKVIRPITAKDNDYWKQQLQEYIEDKKKFTEKQR